MTDAVTVALITSGVTLVGTIGTYLTNMKGISDKLDAHIKADDERAMKQARIRILRFDSDLRKGAEFTEDYFDDIIEDINDYEAYCEAHPLYKNNKCGFAIEHIKESFKKREEEQTFLNIINEGDNVA